MNLLQEGERRESRALLVRCFLGRSAVAALATLVGVVAARLLDPAERGVYQTVMSGFMFLGAFIVLPGADVAAEMMSTLSPRSSTVLLSLLIQSFASWVLGFCLLQWSAVWSTLPEGWVVGWNTLRVLWPFLFLACSFYSLCGVLRACNRQFSYHAVLCLEYIGMLIGFVFLWANGQGSGRLYASASFLASSVASVACVTVIMLTGMGRDWGAAWRETPAILRAHVSRSVRLMPATWGVAATHFLTPLVVAAAGGVTMAGYYAVCVLPLEEVGRTFGGIGAAMVHGSFGPHGGSLRQRRRNITLAYCAVLGLAALAGLVLALFGKWLFGAVFGSRYLQATDGFLVAVPVVVGWALTGVAAPHLIGKGLSTELNIVLVLTGLAAIAGAWACAERGLTEVCAVRSLVILGSGLVLVLRVIHGPRRTVLEGNATGQ